MKKIILMCVLAQGVSVLAQPYFTKRYYTSSDEYTQRGEVAYLDCAPTCGPTNGHIFSGYSTSTGNPLTITAVAEDGEFAGYTPVFSNTYTLYADNSMTTTYPSSKCLALEMGSGYNYNIAFTGDYTRPTNKMGVYYGNVRAQGAVSDIITAVNYNGACYVTSVDYDISVRDVVWNSSGTRIYIMGQLYESGGSPEYSIFLLVINPTTGALVTQFVYSDLSSSTTMLDPREIIVNTNTSPATVTIVGSFSPSGGTDWDGFVLLDDESSLGTAPVFKTFGASGQHDHLEGVVQCNTGNNYGGGIAVCGYTDQGASVDAWAIHLSNDATTTNWTYIYESGYGTNLDNYAFDIIERENTTPAFNYYISGTLKNGPHGSDDIEVFKLDDNGQLSGSDDYVYGNSGVDAGVKIDFDESATVTDVGFSVYGIYDDATNNYDHCIVKSCFNGASNCGNTYSGSYNSGPDYRTDESFTSDEVFTAEYLWINQPSTLSKTNYCNGSAAGCSNARMAGSQHSAQLELNTEITDIASGTVKFAVISDENQHADIRLYSLEGKLLYAGTHLLAAGNNQITLDISHHSLSTGVYLLSAETLQTKTTEKVFMY